jgi:cell division protein FtsB
MNDADTHQDRQDLIGKIERKDQRFRVFQSITMAILGAGIIALLFLNYSIQSYNHRLLANGVQTLSQEQQIIDQQKKTIDVLSMKITDLGNHIDCIVDLFGQPNRASLTIKDISSCQILNNVTNPAIVPNNSMKPVTQPATADDAEDKSASRKAKAVTPSEPFLQRDIAKPIMHLVNMLKGLLN